MNSDKLERMFGITHERVVEIDEAAARGELPGTPAGPVVVGRPARYGQTMRTVTFKETPEVIDAMDARAHRLGMRRSDYLRSLVAADLVSAS